MTTWLTDSSGNKCSIEYFGSIEKAQKALDSLVGCTNCINCSTCKDCRDCYICRACTKCVDCYSSQGCADCAACADCLACLHCYGCRRSFACYDCNYCDDCRACGVCSTYKGYAGKVGEKGVAPIIPKLENIHQKIYEVVSAPDAFTMERWHTCATTHCRGGWVNFLAGKEGEKLEEFYGPALSALLIYKASSPLRVGMTSFFEFDEKIAMADMKRLAEEERASLS